MCALLQAAGGLPWPPALLQVAGALAHPAAGSLSSSHPGDCCTGQKRQGNDGDLLALEGCVGGKLAAVFDIVGQPIRPKQLTAHHIPDLARSTRHKSQ